MPVVVRRRVRVAEPRDVTKGAHLAVGELYRLRPGHARVPRRTDANELDRPDPDVVDQRGESEEPSPRAARDGEPGRRALVEVGQQLARSPGRLPRRLRA